jgi:hypothetical protein
MTTLNVDTWQSVSGTSYNRCLQTATGIQAANNQFQISSSGTSDNFYDLPITVTITSKKANSKFFLMSDIVGYIQATDCACNTGFSRTIGATRTLVLGVNGSGSDSWVGFGNSSAWGNSTSYNIARTFIDAPNVAAGTSITYTVTYATIAASTGHHTVGWNTYLHYNKIIVLEIEA